jgi:hypothetical protein
VRKGCSLFRSSKWRSRSVRAMVVVGPRKTDRSTTSHLLRSLTIPWNSTHAPISRDGNSSGGINYRLVSKDDLDVH